MYLGGLGEFWGLVTTRENQLEEGVGKKT